MYLGQAFAEAGVVSQVRANNAIKRTEDERLFNEALKARTEAKYTQGEESVRAYKRFMRLRSQIRSHKLRTRL